MPLSVKNIYNESWFEIENVDAMRTFFMSIVSNSNHWMFIASNGGLTAGRKNAEFALFPYYTDDKLVDLAHTAGPYTAIRIIRDGKKTLWEPLSPVSRNKEGVKRNLYKNRYGNKLLFEEILQNEGLVFRYQWNNSHEFGFVRKAEVQNTGKSAVKLEILDGLQNILPFGVGADLQNAASNLVDAYKRSERVTGTNLGIFALSAKIVDRAEPSEALKANTVFTLGLDAQAVLLSSRQLEDFRLGEQPADEFDVKGEKGAYFTVSSFAVQAGETKSWTTVANTALDHAQVASLNVWLGEKRNHLEEIQANIEAGTAELIALVTEADGFQFTNDPLKDARHYNNVMFNVMRGGIFDADYQMHRADFETYLKKANQDVYNRNKTWISKLSNVFDLFSLEKALENVTDNDLNRLAREYLPLRFSRRHGDPSRPWNRFSINTFSETTGEKILDYEGNWRDIFQNWEALVQSYPYFIEGMISKFLNASTFDGYNPYRVTKGGFDWESIEPHNPWSYIGYWGDHQIIYLLKFLEFYADAAPEKFKNLLHRSDFVYANVPYRIRPYADICANPKDTISFDEHEDITLRAKMAAEGADAAVLRLSDGSIYHVAFFEKILSPVLAKLSNFIPGAGIWLNTQRPEWNDANNALVGNGVSMVTLYYLRRHMNFLLELLRKNDVKEVALSVEMARFFEQVNSTFLSLQAHGEKPVSDVLRKEITDSLGNAGSEFRSAIYAQGFSGKTKAISVASLVALFDAARDVIDQTIRENRRPDGLYHAYNLITYRESGISIQYLYEMLEGQVAALSSGLLSGSESVHLLDAMRNSALYRADQHSYLLYPDRELQKFAVKNLIPDEKVKSSALLQALIQAGNRDLVVRDVRGAVHFNGSFTNVNDVKAVLKKLESTTFGDAAKADFDTVCDIFESVFNHKAFTGRSGTFFGYEGLGSIYWHMVSKLHLAVFEVYKRAVQQKESAEIIAKLAAHFDAVGEGIGLKKEPKLFGAFPVDPYSHTPKHKGAQQPGMTGQVKEDVLVRRSELGLAVHDGKLHFQPSLLMADAFSKNGATVTMLSASKKADQIDVPANGLCFTCCHVPVIYTLAEKNGLAVMRKNGSMVEINGLSLDESLTSELFSRSGAIQKILVSIRKDELRPQTGKIQ